MCGRRKIYRTAEELRLAKNASSRDSHRIARHENWAFEHPEPSRTTLNSAPTPDQLLRAFNHRNDSPADMIRLGSLLEDIEALFGVGYERTDDLLGGTLVDWDAPLQTGIRGWLRQVPVLLAKYKTLMRYKKLSADFRKVIGLKDPYPTAWVFDRRHDCRITPVLENADRILEEAKPCYTGLMRRIKEKMEHDRKMLYSIDISADNLEQQKLNAGKDNKYKPELPERAINWKFVKREDY
jgi:hypothetical protein